MTNVGVEVPVSEFLPPICHIRRCKKGRFTAHWCGLEGQRRPEFSASFLNLDSAVQRHAPNPTSSSIHCHAVHNGNISLSVCEDVLVIARRFG